MTDATRINQRVGMSARAQRVPAPSPEFRRMVSVACTVTSSEMHGAHGLRPGVRREVHRLVCVVVVWRCVGVISLRPAR